MRFKEFGLIENDRSKIEFGQIEFIDNEIRNLIKKENEKNKKDVPFIYLKVGDKDYLPAAGAIKTKGSNKSDCTIIDQNNNPLAYISLKGDSHYWGRWIRLMKWYAKPENLHNNPKLDFFLSSVKKITGGTLMPGESFHMDTVSEIVQRQIMYGLDFGKDRGINNVDIILKGKPEILRYKNYYVLTATKVYKNGEIPEEYEAPKLVIHYVSKGKRGGINNANIDSERAGSRRNSLPLNNNADVTAAKEQIEVRRNLYKQQDIKNVSPQGSQSNLPTTS